MKLKNVLLIFSITVIMANSMAIFAAEKLIGKDIEKPLLSSEEKGTDRKAVTYGALNADTLPLTGDRVIRIRELLGQDHENNVRDLINSRWFFRKFANYTESLGNVLLYLGTGLSTIATGVTILGPKETANTLQFISTVCFAAHVTFLGFARCSAKEEDEREVQLKSLADAVGFTVVALEPKILDDGDLEKNSSQNK